MSGSARGHHLVVVPVRHDPLMSVGEGLLVQALEALDFPVRRIQKVAAWVLVLAALAFPITSRHALTQWSQAAAKAIVERFQDALPTVGSTEPARTRPNPMPR